jgi:hypothetical protein
MMNTTPPLIRKSLFEIPYWIVHFDEVAAYHQEMVQEVETLIDRDIDTDDPPRYLAHQTASDPFNLPSHGWRILEQLSNQVYSDLAKKHFQRWRSGQFHLRRWAIRFGYLSEGDKERLTRDSVHNHLPALFSSIYYLSVPEEFAEKTEGGTRFINPIGNLMDFMGPRENVIAPKEGRFIVFPSFVDHAPIPFHWDASDKPRIVISSDVFYVSGEALNRPPAAVVKAEPDRN